MENDKKKLCTNCEHRQPSNIVIVSDSLCCLLWICLKWYRRPWTCRRDLFCLFILSLFASFGIRLLRTEKSSKKSSRKGRNELCVKTLKTIRSRDERIERYRHNHWKSFTFLSRLYRVRPNRELSLEKKTKPNLKHTQLMCSFWSSAARSVDHDIFCRIFGSLHLLTLSCAPWW